MPSAGAAAVLGQGHVWHRWQRELAVPSVPCPVPIPDTLVGPIPTALPGGKSSSMGTCCRRDGTIGVIYPMAVHSQSSTQLFKKKNTSGFRPFFQIQPHFSGALGNHSLIPLWGSLGWDSFTSQTP